MYIHMEILYTLFILFFLVYVLTIYSLLQKWRRLTEWAKFFYLVLLFTGIGPIPILIMLSLGIGFR